MRARRPPPANSFDWHGLGRTALALILSDHVSPDTESISVIDLHTGLGPPGYGEPIHLGPQGEDFQRALDWFEPSVKSTSLGDSVSTPVTGSIADGIREFLPHARTTYIALEFGTVRVLKVLAALRADNWLHMIWKQKSSFAKQFGDQMRNAFFVDELWCKAVVVGRFADLSLRAARGLASCNIRGHTSGLLESRP